MSKHTTTPATLDARVTYTNKYSGGRTVELSHEAERVVRDWLQGRGVELEDVARRPRRNKRGHFTFGCGIGYAVIDADLLGGNGSGELEREFNNATGRYIAIR